MFVFIFDCVCVCVYFFCWFTPNCFIDFSTRKFTPNFNLGFTVKSESLHKTVVSTKLYFYFISPGVSLFPSNQSLHFSFINQTSNDSLSFSSSTKLKSTFQQPHEISNNKVCATSKASDQPAHMHSLIRAFASEFEYSVNIKILSY